MSPTPKKDEAKNAAADRAERAEAARGGKPRPAAGRRGPGGASTTTGTGNRQGEPTKQSEATSFKVDKAEGQAGLKAVAPTRAQQVIHEAVAKRAVHGGAIKLPEFPAPASDRPEALKGEEKRREAIRIKEEARRAALLEGLTDEEVKRLEQEWQADDALSYRADPDDKEIEIYAIQEPFVYIQVIKNTRTHVTLYHVIEPKLTRDEKLLLNFIEQTLVDVLDLQPSELDKSDLRDYIKGKFDQVLFEYSISLGDEESTEEQSKERLLYYVLRDFIGEGPIDPVIKDPMIEDISCDGPHQPVFIYHRKYESITTTIRFRDHATLDSFVIRLAQRAGKHVSIAEPILDATMRDGSRLQATLAKEVSSFGSTFTIRKFREVPFSPVDLVRFGTMSSSMLAYLWMIIQFHMSAIYAGGTASGKTTAINAIMLFIPPQLKVITIEDTREINIPQPNWIAGITRGGFGPRDAHGRQAGEIDMFQLLKNALRQRPEYIIVGEVRGAEAYNLFQAMATGHAAYGTMHADSVDAVIHRLESDPINIPRALLEALDVVCVQIQTRVGGKRVRRTKQITEIVGLDPNTREILTNEVFTWDPATDKFLFSGISYSLERIAAESGLTSEQVAQEMEDRVRVINWMVDQDVRIYAIVSQIITAYFHDKKRVLTFVDEDKPWQEPGAEAYAAARAQALSDAATSAPPPTPPQPPEGGAATAPPGNDDDNAPEPADPGPGRSPPGSNPPNAGRPPGAPPPGEGRAPFTDPPGAPPRDPAGAPPLDPTGRPRGDPPGAPPSQRPSPGGKDASAARAALTPPQGAPDAAAHMRAVAPDRVAPVRGPLPSLGRQPVPSNLPGARPLPPEVHGTRLPPTTPSGTRPSPPDLAARRLGSKDAGAGPKDPVG